MPKTKYTNKEIVKRIARIERDNKTETKKYAVKYSAQTIGLGTAGGGFLVKTASQVVGGSESFARVGNRIKLKYLELKFFINAHASAPLTRFRLLIVQPYSTEDTLIADSFAFNDEVDPDRYRLIYDRFIPLVVGASNEMVRIQKRFNIRSTVNFDSDAGDAVKNQLHLYMCADQGVYKPTINGTWELRYIDP